MSHLDGLTPEQIQLLIARIPELPVQEKVKLLEDLEQFDLKNARRRAREHFLTFCHRVYPGFKEGPHHRHLAPLLEDMARPDGYTWGSEEEPPWAKRMTVSMPPRFGKSETIAFLYVAWYLGHNPKHQIMMVTHTEDLSSAFGRKVRDLIDTEEYQAIFEGSVQVSKDKSASGNWTTVQGGVYLALGVGGSAAGKGAHLLVCDDLVSEQAVLYGNPEQAFEHAWNYIQVGPLQRLMPGGRIIMIGCMTAETRVLMADGAEKELQHVKVGDEIATYDNGSITTSRVTNWIKHRDDTVYKIKTMSGKIVRANKRHPFLVDRNGERTWVRVRDLKVGDCLVEAVQPQDASGRTKPKDCALSATSENSLQMAVQVHSAAMVTGGSGGASSVLPTGAATPHMQKGCAEPATTPLSGVLASTASRTRRSARAISSTVMGWLWEITTRCWPRKTGAVLSADNYRPEKTHAQDRRPSSTSTTATALTGSAGCSATTATSQSGTPSPRLCCAPLPNTYDVTTAPIVEIVEDGFEPVFDMEVERTENFIANGVVSHNTRWGKRDPIARAIQWSKDKANEGAMAWHEVRFPAIMEVERGGEMVTVSLWPEQWPVKELLAKKANMRPHFWAAQYMQEPTNEEAALLKRENWRLWTGARPPECHYIIQTWDTAHETKTRNDYSACTTWGVFWYEPRNRNEIILLDYWKDRVEYPELKKKAKELHDKWEPDDFIIEKKAAGAPLIQELRRTGLFVMETNPSRGKSGLSNDKYARTNAVADIFEDGLVWVPDTKGGRELVEVCADFPNGEYDDPVDCTVMAMERFRKGGFVTLSSDEPEDDNPVAPPRAAYY